MPVGINCGGGRTHGGFYTSSASPRGMGIVQRGRWDLTGVRSLMVRFVAYVVATVVATLALGTISERLITFDRAETVLLFAVVLGGINAFIKPIVNLLTLPITCLTFGLFAIIVNAALFWLGAYVTPNLEVSWWGALFGSLLVSVAAGIIFTVIDE